MQRSRYGCAVNSWMKSNRRRLAVLLGIVVSALLLWLAFRDLNPAAFWESIQQANIALLLVAVVVYLIVVVIISQRWQFLLRSLAPIPLQKLVQLVSIGYMGNNIFPMRGGEVLRIALLRRNHGVPYARGATTVVVERIFDGLVMLTYLIVPLVFIRIDVHEINHVAYVAAPVFLTALVVFFVLATRPNILLQLALWVSHLLPGKLGDLVKSLSEEIVNGLVGLRTPADFLGMVVTSYAAWATEALAYWVVAFAFGIHVSYPAMLMTIGLVNLAGIVPASPGMVGVFEFFGHIALRAVGVNHDLALAYIIAVHVVIWLTPTITGFIFLMQQGLSLSAVTEAQEIQQQLESAES